MENRRDGNKLSNEDTFELYKAFMELAEAEEALGGTAPLEQKIRIDKKVDEERYRDLQKGRRAYGRPGDEDFVGLYEPGMGSYPRIFTLCLVSRSSSMIQSRSLNNDLAHSVSLYGDAI